MSVKSQTSMSVGEVLGSVAAAATTITTGLNVLGDAAAVARLHSQSWLRVSASTIKDREEVALQTSRMDTARSLLKLTEELESNDKLAAVYQRLCSNHQGEQA